jgi:hypothetical protein
MLKLAYKIRTKHYLLNHNRHSTNEYIPQLYKKLQGWHPPPAPNNTEDKLTNFEKLLKEALHHNSKRKHLFRGLTPLQFKTLKELKNSQDFIILPTDKNLGPAILNRKDYITQVLSEHLLTNSYQNLPAELANHRITETKQLLKTLFYTHKNQLSQPEITYFERSFKARHRTPIFYGMPKIHKNPMSLRPVVSCVNSFSSVFSNWLDFRMKELLRFIPSYIKDSKDLLTELKSIYIPPHAKLFTADATAMYTNIDTITGVTAIRDLIATNQHLIPSSFPSEFFLRVLEIVMDNNIFTFGNTFWLQNNGTAMGTPAAPLYSILSFGHHENITVLQNFPSNILFYRRYIDDILGIWIDSTPGKWEEFISQLNTFGNLRWNVENLSHQTTFLDLEISIINGVIKTKTFQKGMNLYLYIPPLSAHPKSCFKGLIMGETLRYWNQNSNKEDFINIMTSFISRLHARGHQPHQLIPMLQAAASMIDNRNTAPNNNPKSQSDSTLFIHWKFHPSDISRNTIRNIYNNTLRGHDNFDNMKIAVSRPQNLRDILCNSKLREVPQQNVSDILHSLSKHTMLPN